MHRARGARARVWQFSLPLGRWESHYICPFVAKKLKVDFSSKAKIPNVRDFIVAKCTVQQYMSKWVHAWRHAAWSSASAACIIHQLHVESPGFSQNVTTLTGEFTTVQVDIQEPYVHCTKKRTWVSVSPVFWKIQKSSQFRMADSRWLD